jgi:hypothetical protein
MRRRGISEQFQFDYNPGSKTPPPACARRRFACQAISSSAPTPEQRRHGGNLVRMCPFVLSAKMGLETRLDRMAEYHNKAIEIATTLADFPEIEVIPNPPHTNMLHVFIRGEADRLEQAALEIAQEQKIWLINGFMPSQIPAYQKFELTVGEGALEFNREEIVALFTTLLEKAAHAS